MKKKIKALKWQQVPRKNRGISFGSIVFKICVLICGFVLTTLGQTNAYFSDTVTSQMSMQAGCWADPPVPRLLAPENSIRLSPGSVVFQWSETPSDCPGVTVNYLFTLYKDVGETPLVESSLLSANQFTVPDLSEGTYLWLVAALDSQGHSSISEVGQFDIEILLVSTLIPAPSIVPVLVDLISPSASPIAVLGLQPVRSQNPPTIGFTLNGLSDEYKKLNYVITYASDDGLQGLVGSTDLVGSSSFVLDPKPMGTCTTGGSCTYHQGIGVITVQVELVRPDNTSVSLEKKM